MAYIVKQGETIYSFGLEPVGTLKRAREWLGANVDIQGEDSLDSEVICLVYATKALHDHLSGLDEKNFSSKAKFSRLGWNRYGVLGEGVN